MARYMWGKYQVKLVAALACGILASACVADGLPPVVEDGDGADDLHHGERGSLAEKLGEVAPLTVAGSGGDDRGSLIRVEAGRSGEFRAESLHEVDLAVLGGYIEVRAIDEEVLAIRDLVIDIDDVEIPDGIISSDVRFTGVQARIARPETFDIAWGERGERAEAIVGLDLIVDWGVSVDGGDMHPLAPVEVEDLEVVLELSRDERGALEAQLAGFRDGVFYEWGGMVELRGLAMDVRAAE